MASPEELVAEYRDVAKNEDEAHYFANVANVDKAVGRLVDHLDKTKQRDNTLIIFTSDNGPETLKRYRSAQRSYGTPGPLRGMKLHTHDAGFRVAGIMNWPKRIKGQQTVNTPISSLDFCQHFANSRAQILQSTYLTEPTSFRCSTESQSSESRSCGCYFNAINEARVAMRFENYKVLGRLPGVKKMQNITPSRAEKLKSVKLDSIEIYDVTRDIAEKNNLAGEDPTLLQRMKQLLQTQYDELLAGSHSWIPRTAK